MKTIVLISCAKEKKEELGKVKAAELYISDLFEKSLTYAKQLTTPENIYILSGKYHLLPLDEEIETYNVFLGDKSKAERMRWGKVVIEQLSKVADLQKDKFIILAGEDYVEPLQESLKNITLPLKGLRPGERLKYLKETIEKNQNETKMILDLHKLFHNEKLTRYTYPFEGQESHISTNGIYIMYEEGETFQGLDRIVRVGTHDGDGNLYKRLKEHYVNENKDRSIFLKRVGSAILAKNKDPYLDVWEVDTTTPENKNKVQAQLNPAHEQQITQQAVAHIRNKISFVVFEVKTKEERLRLEKKIIATLSKAAKDGFIEPSQGWLGNFSPDPKVRQSGLWQSQHLDGEPLTSEEFDKLKQIVLS